MNTILSPEKSKYISQLQNFHQYQGNLNDCGPFSTAIIINALLNLNIDGFKLGMIMNKPHWHGPFPLIRRIPGWATFPWGIVDTLKDYGINSHWNLFNHYSQLNQNFIENNISIVIIGKFNPIWAHYLLLVEFNLPKGGFGFIDPASNTSAIKWIESDSFYPLWSNFGRLLITVKPPLSIDIKSNRAMI